MTYSVTNIDGIIKEFTNETDFIKYVQDVYKENEAETEPPDLPYFPANALDAEKYLSNYCDNLELLIF